MHNSRDLTAALTQEMQQSMSPADVIRYLKDGNQRFLSDEPVERNLLEQVKNTAHGRHLGLYRLPGAYRDCFR